MICFHGYNSPFAALATKYTNVCCKKAYHKSLFSLDLQWIGRYTDFLQKQNQMDLIVQSAKQE